jgi:ribosomal-protein-alanine N-acetyltransferase
MRSGEILLEPISPKRKTEFLRLARLSRDFHRPWTSAPDTEIRFRKYLDRIGDDSFRCFFVIRRADDQLIGVINVSQIIRRLFQSAFLGYYVFAPYANQGYMGQGLALVLREAFTKLKLHRLEANIQPGNRPSKKLVKRLGFRREGFSPKYLRVDGKWTDHERFAITREMWSPR